METSQETDYQTAKREKQSCPEPKRHPCHLQKRGATNGLCILVYPKATSSIV